MRTTAMGAAGPQVAVIGQGTWAIEHDDEPVRALRAGIDLGMTHIDTAEMYGRGRVERIVGEAIRGRREEVYVVSKVLSENAARKQTIKACERSLKNLGVESLDLYLLHAPSIHPFEETLSAFERLLKDGKIAGFGVSNFDAAQLRAAVELAGPGRIACNQVVYHLLDRSIEEELLAECGRSGVAMVGYSPLGQGSFPSWDPVLNRIAEIHDATPQQVALAFLVRRPGTFAIPKASRLEHVRQNAEAAGLMLSADEIDRIDRHFPV